MANFVSSVASSLDLLFCGVFRFCLLGCVCTGLFSFCLLGCVCTGLFCLLGCVCTGLFCFCLLGCVCTGLTTCNCCPPFVVLFVQWHKLWHF